jgi:hypothetical protein
MYDAYDVDCPAHHFRPQHQFNATCGLSFSEPLNASTLTANLREYYENRGGRQFFGYDFDDPRLAVCFFRLGSLVNLSEYRTLESRQVLRFQLQAAEVVSWTIH